MSKKRINWNSTKKDDLLVKSISNRVLKDFPEYCRDKQGLEMDILATHLNGCPLNLKKLLETDDFNFMHDILGIGNCIDRNTGKLKNCFVPRCIR